jgi:transcriptional regulator with XRE-family HTH domain
VTDSSFCARLRRERERRQIALSSISANTKIRVGLFESLERGDVSRWPAGIYRRATIRAYATAIGLDPDETTREFCEEFPDPDQTPQKQAADGRPAGRVSRETVLRLTLADERSPFTAGRLLQRMRDRFAAIAIDACVVLAIATSIFVASEAFWVPLAVTLLGYYLGGILLLGNTPGVCLRATAGRAPGPSGRGPGARSFLITLKSTIATSAVAWFARFKRPAQAPPPGSLRPIR